MRFWGLPECLGMSAGLREKTAGLPFDDGLVFAGSLVSLPGFVVVGGMLCVLCPRLKGIMPLWTVPIRLCVPGWG